MADLKMERRFDPKRYRHYLNDHLTVLHCHHYATLFTQLALDAKDIVDGTEVLQQTAEDVFHGVLSDYYKKQGVNDNNERMALAVDMFSALGLGKMNAASFDENGGQVDMPFPYVDEGWLKKWGKSKNTVNFIGAGYVAGMFSAVYDKPTRTYSVKESESKAMGAGKSVFKVTG
jgi:hypothetical protein